MAIISNSWIIAECSNYCYWPNYVTQMKLSRLIVAHAKLDINKCIKCRINIKYRTANYCQAAEKLKLLEDQSSVSQSSDYEGSEENNNSDKRRMRNRRKNGFYDDFQCSDISDDSMSMGPVPPKLTAPVKSFEVPTDSERRIYTQLGSSYQNKVNQGPSQIQQELVMHTPMIEKHQQMPSRITQEQIIPCAECKTNQGLLVDLLTKIETISDDIKYLMMCQNVASNVESTHNLGCCFTKKDIEDLNSSLLETEQFSSMCNSLQTVGGKDSVDTIRRILNRIMSNELAISYNWTGRNNKNNFSLLANITKLILVATRRNQLAKNTTQQQVEDTIKLYLRNASDRDGGRERRKKLEENKNPDNL